MRESIVFSIKKNIAFRFFHSNRVGFRQFGSFWSGSDRDVYDNRFDGLFQVENVVFGDIDFICTTRENKTIDPCTRPRTRTFPRPDCIIYIVNTPTKRVFTEYIRFSWFFFFFFLFPFYSVSVRNLYKPYKWAQKRAGDDVRPSLINSEEFRGERVEWFSSDVFPTTRKKKVNHPYKSRMSTFRLITRDFRALKTRNDTPKRFGYDRPGVGRADPPD